MKKYRIVNIEYPDNVKLYAIMEHISVVKYKRYGFLFLKRRKVVKKEWRFIKCYGVDSIYEPVLFESRKKARHWLNKYR